MFGLYDQLDGQARTGRSDPLRNTNSIKAEASQFKAENQENDAVTDDLAGRAYVEQFGLETLQRADNAVRANKASRYCSIRLSWFNYV